MAHSMTRITGITGITGMTGVTGVTRVTRVTWMTEMNRCPSYRVSFKSVNCTQSHVMIQRVKCSVFNVMHVYILSKR